MATNAAFDRTLQPYKDLPRGLARGVFGDDDWLGCLNLLTPARVAAAAGLIKTGQVFSLNASISHYNDPSFFGGYAIPGWEPRKPPTHTIHEVAPFSFDEKLDGFFSHHASQWDHFLHHGDAENGSFYNGHLEHDHGVQAWAEKGLAGRGVLLDVARWSAENGAPIDWLSARVITVADLEACAEAQGVEIVEGTILLIRMGWQTGYDSTSRTELEAIHRAGQPSTPGIESSAAMAARLWDWGVAAVAGDNPTLEAFGLEYFAELDPSLHFAMHLHLLGRLGIPIGEFFLMDRLAEACAEAGRYEFFITSAPMNLAGGVGTPANALAIL